MPSPKVKKSMVKKLKSPKKVSAAKKSPKKVVKKSPKKSEVKSPKKVVKKSPSPARRKFCILFTMYIGDTKERRDVYENRIARWLDESTGIDLYTVDSSGKELFLDDKTNLITSPHYFDPRLHQFSFKQPSAFQSGNPSMPEKRAMLKAIKHFKKEFSTYDIIFKITGKYFIPNFVNLIKFNTIPKDIDIVFQYRQETHGQNTEVIGFSPRIFESVVNRINDQKGFEDVVAEIRISKTYRTHRLDKLPLDSFTKRSDGSILRYLMGI